MGPNSAWRANAPQTTVKMSGQSPKGAASERVRE